MGWFNVQIKNEMFSFYGWFLYTFLHFVKFQFETVTIQPELHIQLFVRNHL